MNQKFDITVIAGGLGREYVGTEFKIKDHYVSFWDCKKSEWAAVSFDVNATISFKPHKNEIFYGVEYDQDERKFKTFEHDDTFVPFGDHIVMNNGMTEDDAEKLCWKYNQVRL